MMNKPVDLIFFGLAVLCMALQLIGIHRREQADKARTAPNDDATGWKIRHASRWMAFLALFYVALRHGWSLIRPDAYDASADVFALMVEGVVLLNFGFLALNLCGWLPSREHAPPSLSARS